MAQFQEIFKSFPPALMKAFGAESTDLNSVLSLLSMKHYGFVWPLLAILLVVSIAGALLAGEIESGSIEIDLSMPISRTKIFFAKYLAGVINMIAFVVVSVFCVFPLGWAYGFTIESANMLDFFLLSVAFCLAIYSLAFMASAILSEKGKVYASTAILLIVMYVANVLSQLHANLDNLKYFSFFYYFNNSDALTKGLLHPSAFYVFIGVAIVSVAIGAIVFNRRDINA
jgi:ABC-2 type transport system permease protein